MITICAGWRDANNRMVHTALKVLVPEDGKDIGVRVSHGICADCKDAFLERAALAHAAKGATLCSPRTRES